MKQSVKTRTRTSKNESVLWERKLLIHRARGRIIINYCDVLAKYHLLVVGFGVCFTSTCTLKFVKTAHVCTVHLLMLNISFPCSAGEILGSRSWTSWIIDRSEDARNHSDKSVQSVWIGVFCAAFEGHCSRWVIGVLISAEREHFPEWEV